MIGPWPSGAKPRAGLSPATAPPERQASRISSFWHGTAASFSNSASFVIPVSRGRVGS